MTTLTPSRNAGRTRSIKALPPQIVEVHGKSVEISVETGTVVGVRRLSETHVGGEFYANGGSGYGNVTSTVVRKTEFALVSDDGQERPHFYGGHKVYIRDGQRLSLIHAKCRRKSNWNYLVNHNTGEFFEFWSPSEFVYAIGLVRKINRWFFVAALVLVFGLGAALDVGDAMAPLLITALGGLFMLKVFQFFRARRIWKRYLRPEFDRLTAELRQ